MYPGLARAAAWSGACAVAILVAAMLIGSPRSLITQAASQFQVAAVFFVQSITVEKMRGDYLAMNTVGDPLTSTPTSPAAPSKVKILIVPGHEPDFGGTAFGSIYERDIAVDIAEDLARLLGQNPRYEV